MARLLWIAGSTLVFSILAGGPASAEKVPAREAGLLEMGPENVGYLSFGLRDSTRGNRSIHLMVWFPTAEDVGGKPVAVYEQVISAPSVLVNPTTGKGMCLPPAPPYTPANTLCTLCVPPSPTATVCSAKMTFDAEDYAASVQAVAGGEFPIAHEGVAVAPGRHPLVIHLPGGGAPGSAYVYEAVKYASHGFIFVSVTHLGANRRLLVQDAEVVINALMSWNQTAGHPLFASFDLASVFGTGHSLGGRSWLAITSGAAVTDPASPEIGLDFVPDGRIRGVALQDATRETLAAQEPSWKAQLQGNDSDVFLNSQQCRPTQIVLQQDLGSTPQRLDLTGVCPLRDGLNHSLFSQTCLLVNAHVIAGNPMSWATVSGGAPVDLVAQCTEPNPSLRCTFVDLRPTVAQYRAREVFFARQTSKFNITYFKTLMHDNHYRAVLAPGQVRDEGVSLINTALGEGGDETVVDPSQAITGGEGFCSQPGSQDHGDSPIWTSDPT